MMQFAESPRNMFAVAQCRRCNGLQGAFLLQNRGTLILGRMVCVACGAVGKPAAIRPVMTPPNPADGVPFVQIQVDDEVHEWPERLAVGEEQFS